MPALLALSVASRHSGESPTHTVHVSSAAIPVGGIWQARGKARFPALVSRSSRRSARPVRGFDFDVCGCSEPFDRVLLPGRRSIIRKFRNQAFTAQKRLSGWAASLRRTRPHTILSQPIQKKTGKYSGLAWPFTGFYRTRSANSLACGSGPPKLSSLATMASIIRLRISGPPVSNITKDMSVASSVR